MLPILVSQLCPAQQEMAQRREVEVDLPGRLPAARQEERGQRLELRGRKTNKALVAMDLILGAMVGTADMADQDLAVVVVVVEQIEAAAAAAVVGQTQQPQAHPVQVELERKARQAPRGKHLPAQQTSPPTQAGRCPS